MRLHVKKSVHDWPEMIVWRMVYLCNMSCRLAPPTKPISTAFGSHDNIDQQLFEYAYRRHPPRPERGTNLRSRSQRSRDLTSDVGQSAAKSSPDPEQATADDAAINAESETDECGTPTPVRTSKAEKRKRGPNGGARGEDKGKHECPARLVVSPVPRIPVLRTARNRPRS